jgi:hypothetical protein
MVLVHEASLGFAVFPAKVMTESSPGATHLQELARKTGTSLSWFRFGAFLVAQLSLPGEEPSHAAGQKLSFIASSAPNPSRLVDRYLKVTLENDSVHLESDVYGSVPYFFSLNHGIISNILPVLEVELQVTEDSLDPRSLFGFLKYGHPIWDETPWKEIRQGIPNSKSLFRLTNGPMILESNEIAPLRLQRERPENSSNESTCRRLASLNDELVNQSLSTAKSVLLFLSSGFDSRLILAGISRSPELRQKTTAVTYGPTRSVEVTAAKTLAKLAGVKWLNVNPPEDFLRSEYLERTHAIFGSSLHMHGMYQIALADQLKKLGIIGEGTVIATGFMSGVPTGQHVVKAKSSFRGSLDSQSFLDSFSQSQYWAEGEIERLFATRAEEGLLGLSEQINKIPLDAQLSIAKQSILVDLWTRQRSFISYHPRVMEFFASVASPHMDRRWLEFFMTVDDGALKNRRLIQDLFQTQYPSLATVPSNSEVFSRTGSSRARIGLFLARALAHLGAPDALSARFGDQPIRFDENAFRKAASTALRPLPLFLPSWLDGRLVDSKIRGLRMGKWDPKSYGSLVSLQSVALSLAKAEER